MQTGCISYWNEILKTWSRYKYFNCKNILEIGSSVGISAAYIAQAGKDLNFTSIEGIQEKIEVAEKIANQLDQNTKFILGDFDSNLDEVIESYEKLDLVYFDGNHTMESTLKYFTICLWSICLCN